MGHYQSNRSQGQVASQKRDPESNLVEGDWLVAPYAEMESLQKLVSEFRKRNPDEKVIKKTMNTLNIPYSSDPMQRMNTVLSALYDLE